ncbi:MAG: MotA/TolQ/ExbB proton channel family protein [Dysgonamonadaceae bacterium]|jgi:biopolymer transport protein ExbB|nr:MotA/TolQ/ExbB proton channel family protein [Dysgonamonadaceae bacterium]
MKQLINVILIFCFLITVSPIGLFGQDSIPGLIENPEELLDSESSFHQVLKTRFIEGSALFMSFIALSLIVGLAFCLERIIYLNLAQVNTKKLLSEVEEKLAKRDVEGAKEIVRDTRGPIASICYQALSRINESLNAIDRSITSSGSVQTGLLEKNLSWITLFIAVAPSIGFLGTVVGMIQSFDNIEQYGDINPSIIAGGMKVALITTVGGLIVAIILQFFYNYILVKIEGIVNEMEDNAVRILDMIADYKSPNLHP